MCLWKVYSSHKPHASLVRRLSRFSIFTIHTITHQTGAHHNTLSKPSDAVLKTCQAEKNRFKTQDLKKNPYHTRPWHPSSVWVRVATYLFALPCGYLFLFF